MNNFFEYFFPFVGVASFLKDYKYYKIIIKVHLKQAFFHRCLDFTNEWIWQILELRKKSLSLGGNSLGLRENSSSLGGKI